VLCFIAFSRCFARQEECHEIVLLEIWHADYGRKRSTVALKKLSTCHKEFKTFSGLLGDEKIGASRKSQLDMYFLNNFQENFE
jgi:hypothetical protein